MSVKVGGEQHAWLHQQWPPPYCCLCNHEALLTTKDAQIGALEKELEWHRDADRQDYIRTGGRSSSKLLEEIAALEAEVERLKHWLVASPAQMSVGGGRLLSIDSTR